MPEILVVSDFRHFLDIIYRNICGFGAVLVRYLENRSEQAF